MSGTLRRDAARRKPAESPGRATWRMIRAGVSWALLIAVAAIACAVIVVPAVAGARPFTILTGSMEPRYPPGTLVVVRPVDPDDIAIGDVITYQLRSGESIVVTHRVVAVQQGVDGERNFITQGDANNTPDESPVRPVQVVGRLWYAVPYIGWINSLVSGSFRAWAIPIVAGGLVAYAVVLFVQAWRERRRRRAAAVDPAPANDAGG